MDSMMATNSHKKKAGRALQVDILKNDAYLAKNGIAFYSGLNDSLIIHRQI